MHRRMRGTVGVAAAGAALAGLAGTVPAYAIAGPSPAAPRPVIKTVIDTVFAGYVTTGHRRFRYVAATVPIARCRSKDTQNAKARVALAANAITQVAHVDLFCGGGRGSVRFGTVIDEGRRLDLAPGIGDVMRISVFRNQAACRDRFTATDTTTHASDTVSVHIPCAVTYRHAELGGVLIKFEGAFKPPPVNVRLWAISNLAITSIDGTRGTPCGPWPAEKHLAAPVIAVRMIPSALTNRCRDFAILLKGKR